MEEEEVVEYKLSKKQMFNTFLVCGILFLCIASFMVGYKLTGDKVQDSYKSYIERACICINQTPWEMPDIQLDYKLFNST